MSNITSASPAEAVFSGFDGVDTRRIHSGAPASADIQNFRITADGSLEKRYGYRHVFTFPSSPRAFWHGPLQDREQTYALCGSTVYAADLATGALKALGDLTTSEGEASFFFYRDSLYLIDGKQIYGIKEEGIEGVFGYVPHFIKDRPPMGRENLHQPLNHLNSFARLSFVVDSEDVFPYFIVDHDVGTLEAVYVNGKRISTDQYGYSSILPCISISGLAKGDRVVAYVHYDSTSSALSDLLSCTSASVFGGVSNSRIFLWNGRKKNMMYASAYVSGEDLEASTSFYRQSDPLYFPRHYEFYVGDGQYRIRGIARHFDRLLIFTEGDVWMASTSACGAEDFPTMNINSTATCAVKDGVAILGNDPVSVGKRTLFRWTTETDEKNECNAYSLSTPIDSKLSDRFFATATLFCDKERGELWFHGRDGSDTVWIYSLSRAAWFRFTGIRADRFFPLGHEVAFLRENQLFCFDPTLGADIDEDGKATPIEASFCSGLLDFGREGVKKLESLTVSAEETADVPTVRITADGISDVILPVNLHPTAGGGCMGHTTRRTRLCSGRFHHAAIHLSVRGTHPLRIHGLTLRAR